MLIPYDHDRFPLWSLEPLQLQAVTYQTDVSLVRMQEIHGPVLGLFSVVAERSCNLKLQRPVTWNQQIRRPLHFDQSLVLGNCIQIPCNSGEKLRFTIGAYAGLKLFER